MSKREKLFTNPNLNPDQLLEQYKLSVDTRKTINEHRQMVHNFLISANAIPVAGIGVFARSYELSLGVGIVLLIVGAVELLLNITWLQITHDYERLSHTKVTIIQEL